MVLAVLRHSKKWIGARFGIDLEPKFPGMIRALMGVVFRLRESGLLLLGVRQVVGWLMLWR